MAKKPLYGKFIASPEFQNKEQAEEFAKEQKGQYKQAGMSLKYDIVRTDNSGWKANIFVKV